ncbi:MAG: potassium channel protein [Nitrospirae bacterium]|nr:potassium channel protein [Nitrospirota bacterium]
MIIDKLKGISVILAIIIMTGILGYAMIEGWPMMDSLYMTVITLSSVGFMEVHPLSGAGRVFTMLLILCGSGVLIYGISVITAFVVEGELTDVIRRKNMDKKIAGLRGHYIVCGADQTSRYIMDELSKTKKDFIVIDKDPDKIRSMMKNDILCIEGDATHDAVLEKAGIKRAKGFITTLRSDAENIFVVITAKRLNPSLRVISRAVEEESEQKIRLAGADSVVMPSYIGGLRMASEMIRPSVVSFLDIMLRSKDATIRVEEIDVPIGSPLSGLDLGAAGILEMEGVSVVALRDKAKDTYVFNPPRKTVLTEDHQLIVMGDISMISKINDMAIKVTQ